MSALEPPGGRHRGPKMPTGKRVFLCSLALVLLVQALLSVLEAGAIHGMPKAGRVLLYIDGGLWLVSCGWAVAEALGVEVDAAPNKSPE